MTSETAVTAFGTPSAHEQWRIGAILRKESIGGILLIVAALAAVILANSPAAGWYHGLRDTYAGLYVGDWAFQMTLSHWAADGLLAVFFFLVGLELKREFVAGDLRSPTRAIVPIVAAVGGVVVPAIIYLGIVTTMSDDAALTSGWAIPAATDIAFAVAVLAVVGRRLPPALRMFLLTLAVVDDLIAILIIAFVYTDSVAANYLVLALIPLIAYGIAVQRFPRLFVRVPATSWAILLPIGVLTWAFVYASGIHATIAGVALALLVPVGARRGAGLAEVLEHRVRPLSAGVCVPLFAFMSAGVSISGLDGGVGALASPVALGVMLGLVVGKPIGITAATWLVTRLRRANLSPGMSWIDVLGMSLLAGIGFTVSLLITELSFESAATVDAAKAAVLCGSVIAAAVGGIALSLRGRQLAAAEARNAAEKARDQGVKLETTSH